VETRGDGNEYDRVVESRKQEVGHESSRIGFGRPGCRSAPWVRALQSAPEKAESDAEVTPSTQAGLGATSWRLVKFQGGDETILRPAEGAEYTIAFEPGGRLTARIDCNRGTGTWQSSGPPQLEFGPLALTRAMCPPGSLHDHMVRQWPYVRSYVIQDGHLFLSLMADGGIYELEPMSPEGSVEGAVRGTATYRKRMALPRGAVLEATLEDVSRADAAAEVIGCSSRRTSTTRC
jgi:heat shock protein HslJ